MNADRWDQFTRAELLALSCGLSAIESSYLGSLHTLARLRCEIDGALFKQNAPDPSTASPPDGGRAAK
jgi:hypothetical protein